MKKMFYILKLHIEKMQEYLCERSCISAFYPDVNVSEAATGGVLWKKVFLEISQNSHQSTCARALFLVKLQAFFFSKVAGLRPATCLKKRLWHVFSCEFCGIPKNTFFTEHLWVTGSYMYRVSILTYFCESLIFCFKWHRK